MTPTARRTGTCCSASRRRRSRTASGTFPSRSIIGGCTRTRRPSASMPSPMRSAPGRVCWSVIFHPLDLCSVRDGLFLGSMRILRRLPEKTRVSIIYRACDGPHQRRALNRSRVPPRSTFFEVILSTVHRSDDVERGGLMTVDDLESDVVVVVNCGIDSVNHEFLEELAAQALREDCGVVGGTVLRADGTILTAGVCLPQRGYLRECLRRAGIARTRVHGAGESGSPSVIDCPARLRFSNFASGGSERPGEHQRGFARHLVRRPGSFRPCHGPQSAAHSICDRDAAKSRRELSSSTRWVGASRIDDQPEHRGPSRRAGCFEGWDPLTTSLDLRSGMLVLPARTFRPRRYRPGNVASWSGHLPFAHDLIAAVRPSLLVELGTHYGESYFAMCQAVQENAVSCKCYAIDTWKGDEHAGSYDESVFEEVNEYNEDNYAAFSKLLRTTFDAALRELRRPNRGSAAHRRPAHLRGGLSRFRDLVSKGSSWRCGAAP